MGPVRTGRRERRRAALDRAPAGRRPAEHGRTRRRWAPTRVVGARFVALLVALFAVVLVAVLARPVQVRGEQVDQRLWLWAWQRGSVAFTNSVTGAPVRIDFGLATGIDRQRMTTDEKTENYYTSGTYDLNARLRDRRSRSLRYCSVVGITVTLASHRYVVEDSCLEIQLLWPPF